MGLPVTVYRWDDAGAPQIVNRTPSEMIDVLKKVLVDGYGSKASLGWSIAFEDVGSQKIAFRNNTTLGSGGYVQFWCPEGSNLSASRFSYRSAQSMPNLDAFVKSGPLGNIWGTSTPTTMKHWMIVGTAAGFYLFTLMNNTSTYDKQGAQSCVVFIGDIHSNYNNDAGRFMAITAASVDVTSSTSPVNIFSGLIPRLYQTDGSSTYLSGNINRSVLAQSPSSATKDDDDTVLGINFATGMITIVAPAASGTTDSAGTPLNQSLLQPFFRGVLPGALSSSFIGYRSKSFPQIRSINGVQHILSAESASTTVGCGTWLNIEEWY